MTKSIGNLPALLNIGANGGIHVGLIGRNIAGVAAADLHRQLGVQYGLNYNFHLFDLDVLSLMNDDIEEFLSVLSAIGFAGVSLASPFAAIGSGRVGSVVKSQGTQSPCALLFRNDGFEFRNTLESGMVAALNAALPGKKTSRVLLVGQDQTAVAIVNALGRTGTQELFVTANDLEETEKLAAHFTENAPPFRRVMRPSDVLRDCDGVVQISGSGANGFAGGPDTWQDLGREHWVVSLATGPNETPLVKSARAAGSTIIPGETVAAYRGLADFAAFTGIELAAPDTAMTIKQY